MRVFAAILFSTGCGLSVVGISPSEGADAGVVAPPSEAGTLPRDKEAGSTFDGGGDAGACACDPWAACEDGCVDVASALQGVRHEIRCTNDNRPACGIAAAAPPDATVQMKGTAGKTYEVVVRVRGVVEERTYPGASAGPATGMKHDLFALGGAENDVTDTWNIYDVRVSAPAAIWHLNRGVSGNKFSDAIDYQATMRVAAGATLTIHADSIDTAQANNQDQNNVPIVISSLSATPFPGQFVQFDLVSVSLR